MRNFRTSSTSNYSNCLKYFTIDSLYEDKDNDVIDRLNSIKYLGNVIDEHLNFENNLSETKRNLLPRFIYCWHSIIVVTDVNN